MKIFAEKSAMPTRTATSSHQAIIEACGTFVHIGFKVISLDFQSLDRDLFLSFAQ